MLLSYVLQSFISGSVSVFTICPTLGRNGAISSMESRKAKLNFRPPIVRHLAKESGGAMAGMRHEMERFVLGMVLVPQKKKTANRNTMPFLAAEWPTFDLLPSP